MMKPSYKTTLATLSAILAPAIVASLYSGFAAGAALLFFGLVHAIFIGLPLYLILYKFDLVRWWTIGIVGFIAGACGPLGLINIIQNFSWTKFNGLLIFGGYGVLGGLSAWLVLRLVADPSKIFKITKTTY